MYRTSDCKGDCHEGRYGNRDDNRKGYGRERDWGHRGDDKYGRGRDSYGQGEDHYGRDANDHYSKDGYRNDVCKASGVNGDNHYASRDRSSDRKKDHHFEDDDQYSSRYASTSHIHLLLLIFKEVPISFSNSGCSF